MNAKATSGTGALALFHPAVAAWFESAFTAPTDAQTRAWPHIRAGESTLVAAPTGSGKTLTAFLWALDELVRDGLAQGGALPDETLVVYVSPLKALSNDIHANLERPLAGIGEELARLDLPRIDIRTAVRTGDTTQQARNAHKRRPPHILVTTPESLYVLLSSDSGRRMLATTRTVIVDEIHAMVASKRGAHLALSLERLDTLCKRRLPRIGLSATQKPIEAVARFLVGANEGARCAIVDVGHHRERDLALELPPVPLEAVMANEVWERVYDRLAELASTHATTLIFVNTRRMAERAARHLTERLGKDAVAAHHGSMAKEHRLDAEQRLKGGTLRVLIATASLELGIDIGDVDLVCQLGSPRAIAAFLQRVGRSGHQVGGMPKGRLFPNSRDDLIECAALIDCVRRGELDALTLPRAPLDVLAQQIVAEVACEEWHEDALFACVKSATPYAGLAREQYDAILRMLAEGYTSRHGPRGAYIHRDVVKGTLRGRRGGKMTAVTSGGTIPDNADYAVLLEPQGLNIGTVNEDFAVESLAGDIFQLGNTSYKIARIEPGRVRVVDAEGQAPNIPFWLGEAPGRSDELSAAISRLRARVDEMLGSAKLSSKGTPNPSSEPGNSSASHAPVVNALMSELRIDESASRQIVDYLARARAALSVLPTQRTLVMERFFDESGGTQLVIHSPFGSRLNRAWGLALRKRFCRTFNFELQAAATEDAIVLSLTGSHSFALDEVWRFLHSNSAEHVLIQALLDAPLFNVRWRWNAVTSLALPRFTGGRKTPPQLQRMKSEDLLAAVFPDQVACLENIVGERELPHHPLVDQTVDDCLHEAMDCEGWLALLRRIEHGDVALVTRELSAPSPLAAEILNARPYAFLDDAPLEERRTQAVLSRRWTDPEDASDLGALDADAIAAVRVEAWPQARNEDEMHEALIGLACVGESEAHAHEGWREWLDALARSGRATRMQVAEDEALWLPVERLTCLRAVYPDAVFAPRLAPPKGFDETWAYDEALVDMLRARMSGLGPEPVSALARGLALPASSVAAALVKLESEGYAMRGRFTPGAQQEEWCERHLLARIHRYTIKRLRREIEPVERADFVRFLIEWQRLAPSTRGMGREALAATLEQLEGFEAAAPAWEEEILPARLRDYTGVTLDELCRSGKFVWARFAADGRSAGAPVRTTPILIAPRRDLPAWHALADRRAVGVGAGTAVPEAISARARTLFDALSRHGAMFFDELVGEARALPLEVEGALGELVAAGLVNADSFAGLRALIAPAVSRHRGARATARRGAHRGAFIGGMQDAGRWALLRRPAQQDEPGTLEHAEQPSGAETALSRAGAHALPPDAIEHVAMTLLRRYGVMFWQLLEREPAWMPRWRDLLHVFHRMEARGLIRGGRFVGGLSGEQFALPEALALLRDVRKREPDGQFVCVCAADPLNIVGTILPGEKVPALVGNRIALRDGTCAATLIAGQFDYAAQLTAAEKEAARLCLAHRG
ncbi:DEAD/DEAH box helicase [Trinickia dinghuensis]|uniref:ATP-dependent DNA helicase n=1 Tax=Trinickia dinghuensis TaxID=2291023 RepID=A0A3D8JY17_9BURK|nr:DEAD/DEAH box helicase [Trinickia dinghuensis]RDU97536.1 ATP-dependent DNA helicase [Trinickia dinghuensis]